MVKAKKSVILAALSCLVVACGGGGGGTDNAVGTQANAVSEDPYGATGAPGADMTDNGVTDGASGLADGNASAAATNATGNAH